MRRHFTQRLLWLVAFTQILASCATYQSPGVAGLQLCAKYERALSTAIVLYETGHLSAGDARVVDRWERQITPICTASTPPTEAAALLLIDQALVELLLVRGQD